MGPFVNILCRNRTILFLLLVTGVCCGSVTARDTRSLDMASLISSASKLLGLDMAEGVANLVSAAFGQPPRRRGDPAEAAPGSKTGPPGMGMGLDMGAMGGSGAHSQGDHQPLAPSLFTGLLKLVGLDPSKLGALALNAVIFVAQMVSNSLIGTGQQPIRQPQQPIRQPQMRYPTGPAPAGYPPGPAGYPPGPAGYPPGFPSAPGSFRNNYDDVKEEEDEEPAGTPVSWMLNNPMLKDSNLMRTAQDPALTDQLEHVVRSRSTRSVGNSDGTTTPCIQQLVCRSAPFVWAMQRSLKDLLNPGKESPTAAIWNSLTPVQRMYAYLPEASEVEERAKLCREKLPACQSIAL